MLLNDYERKTIKGVLSEFGFSLRGNGGSSEVLEDGAIVYHLSIDTRSAVALGRNLGKRLRDALGAQKVYNMGVKL